MEIFKMDFKNVNVNFGEALKWKSDYCVILHKYALFYLSCICKDTFFYM